MLSFKTTFSLLFHFHQESLKFLFAFYHKGGVICISEVIDISPSNLSPGNIIAENIEENLDNKLSVQADTMEDSVQFSRSVVSDSSRPHELHHARPPCPSPTPGVHSDSHPSSQRCHPAISSSVVPFSSCLQSLPASESFTMSQLFA